MVNYSRDDAGHLLMGQFPTKTVLDKNGNFRTVHYNPSRLELLLKAGAAKPLFWISRHSDGTLWRKVREKPRLWVQVNEQGNPTGEVQDGSGKRSKVDPETMSRIIQNPDVSFTSNTDEEEGFTTLPKEEFEQKFPKWQQAQDNRISAKYKEATGKGEESSFKILSDEEKANLSPAQRLAYLESLRAEMGKVSPGVGSGRGRKPMTDEEKAAAKRARQIAAGIDPDAPKRGRGRPPREGTAAREKFDERNRKIAESISDPNEKRATGEVNEQGQKILKGKGEKIPTSGIKAGDPWNVKVASIAKNYFSAIDSGADEREVKEAGVELTQTLQPLVDKLSGVVSWNAFKGAVVGDELKDITNEVRQEVYLAILEDKIKSISPITGEEEYKEGYFRRWVKKADEYSVSSFIYGVARNKALDIFTNKFGINSEPTFNDIFVDDEGNDISEALLGKISDSSKNIDDEYADKEYKDRLYGVVLEGLDIISSDTYTLDNKGTQHGGQVYAEAVMLRYIRGMSSKEISELYSSSPQNITPAYLKGLTDDEIEEIRKKDPNSEELKSPYDSGKSFIVTEAAVNTRVNKGLIKLREVLSDMAKDRQKVYEEAAAKVAARKGDEDPYTKVELEADKLKALDKKPYSKEEIEADKAKEKENYEKRRKEAGERIKARKLAAQKPDNSTTDDGDTSKSV